MDNQPPVEPEKSEPIFKISTNRHFRRALIAKERRKLGLRRKFPTGSWIPRKRGRGDRRSRAQTLMDVTRDLTGVEC